jgi:DNA gyrase/topoisomerase IV subunit A
MGSLGNNKGSEGVEGNSLERTSREVLAQTQEAMERLSFSEIQAQAILDLQLRRLSALERQKNRRRVRIDHQADC